MDRTELKFILSVPQAEILKTRLRAILKTDPHGQDGTYRVRSLYFDTADNSFFEANLAGAGKRTKYRLRLYNGDTRLLRIEKKEREYNRVHKFSSEITQKDTLEFLAGKSPAPEYPDLRPVCICEYKRTAFVYPVSHVRITFDEELCASADCDRFLSGDFLRIPVTEPGSVLMEVKFDEFLPEFIRDTIRTGTLSPNSFSKFVRCRSITTVLE